jgi:hypothetical protein
MVVSGALKRPHVLETRTASRERNNAMRNLHQRNYEVSPPPKPAARRSLHAVKPLSLSFATWFAQQMHRDDAVGQIARDCGGAVDSFGELIDGLQWNPVMTDVDFRAAYQAQREYAEKIRKGAVL